MPASPALAPPPGNPRFPLLDSVRGLAAVAIVFGHAYAAVSGHGYWDNLALSTGVAVQVFFALSGFLLVRPYLAAHARGERGPSAATFWRRRVLRIVPAYWVALTLTAIFVPAAAVGAFSDRWWVFYGFGQVYSLTDNFHGLPVAWSLSTEASFYLAVPALALLMRRLGALPVLIGLLALGPVVHLLNTYDLGPTWTPLVAKVTYGLPGETNFFAVGILLALWSVRGAPAWLRWLAVRPALCWAGAVALYLLLSALFSFANPVGGLSSRVRFVGLDLATAAFALLVLVPAAFDERPGVVRRLLAGPSIVYAGMVSYGLYLWHGPLGVVLLDHGLLEFRARVPFAVAVAVTFAVLLTGGLLTATISYYVVELPFLRLKERRLKATLMGRARESTGAA